MHWTLVSSSFRPTRHNHYYTIFEKKNFKNVMHSLMQPSRLYGYTKIAVKNSFDLMGQNFRLILMT